jgi:hypothetical protein
MPPVPTRDPGGLTGDKPSTPWRRPRLPWCLSSDFGRNDEVAGWSLNPALKEDFTSREARGELPRPRTREEVHPELNAGLSTFTTEAAAARMSPNVLKRRLAT